jgi:hypothetical protein
MVLNFIKIGPVRVELFFAYSLHRLRPNVATVSSEQSRDYKQSHTNHRLSRVGQDLLCSVAMHRAARHIDTQTDRQTDTLLA